MIACGCSKELPIEQDCSQMTKCKSTLYNFAHCPGGLIRIDTVSSYKMVSVCDTIELQNRIFKMGQETMENEPDLIFKDLDKKFPNECHCNQ